MAIGPRLEFRQSQTLTLTPQLMQSIRLLQLSHLELNAFVEAELERNPLLEREEASETRDGGSGRGGPRHNATISTSTNRASRSARRSPCRRRSTARRADIFPDQVGAEPSPDTGRMISEGGSGGEQPDIDSFVASTKSLADHLHDQIVHLLRDPADRLIATHLIENLDEAGYLTTGCDAIAQTLGVERVHVEEVLEIVQTCEPTGVFARNLAECLSLQLAERDRLDPYMERLLAHLELVANHDLQGLMRIVGCDREDLADMLGELRELDPRPGRAFDGAPIQAIVPDVFVQPGARWRLGARTQFRRLAARAGQPHLLRPCRQEGPWRRGTQFSSLDCLQTANWLTRSLDQRAQTILKVAAEIVRQQDAFPAARHRPSQADDAQDGGRADQHARIDRQPRHGQQIPGDAARACSR